MRSQKYLHVLTLCSVVLAMSLTSIRAQNATWVGPNTGGEWNTSANWDIGDPAGGTNAVIGGGTNVNYNIPMAAAGIGILTNNGVLNINAAGFNCANIVLPNPSGGDKIFLNNGASATVGGNLIMSTNASVTMAAGASLTVNGTLNVSFSSSSKASGTATFTNTGGTFSSAATVINNASGGTGNGLVVISGGNNNLGNTSVGRSSAGSGGFNALGSEGLAIYGGTVTISNLNVGNGNAQSFLTALIAGGTVTNMGNVSINQATSPRASRLLQTAGLFVVPDPNVVNPNGTVSGSISIYSVTGGTNIVGGFVFGNTNLSPSSVNFTNNAIIYVGSQGIASNAVTLNASLGNGGMFGATAPWVGNVSMKLPGGMFTFQAADMNGNSNNITISNVLSGSGGFNKTGGGILTLDATNTYAGSTMINAGTVAVGGTGSLLNSLDIFVGSGATFDVSQDTGYTVNGSPVQTLSGLGTVNGAVNVASGGTIYPGSNSLTGTLTLNGGLTETGGAVNEFNLSGSPSGPNNDFMNASGGLTVSGVNSIQINGNGLQSGGAYPLIFYGGGGFNGSVANFTVVGATGILSNSVTAQTIYLVVQTAVRPSTNLTWVGSVANNNWDTETTSNWVDTGSAHVDYFVPEDNVLFGNLEVTNVINIVGSPTPGSITVNTTTNYTFAGPGEIDGNGTLTVSNGTLTILTTNIFNAPVILDGGVLSTPNIANSSTPSGIGESSSSPGNLVFNGGTLAYTGGSTSTDHGLTLTNGGGTIDVINGSSLTISGSIIGNGTLKVVDSGTLVLNNPNSYTNTTTIAGGALRLSNANGAGTGTINFSNATLIYNSGLTVPNNFNFVPGTTNLLAVPSGSGGNPISSGDWTGSGVVLVSNAFNPYTLNGNLNGFSGTVVLDTPVAGDQLRFNSGGGNTCTGSTNATFDLSNTNAALSCRNPGVISLGALVGTDGAQLIGPTATAGTLIWSIGANNLSTTYGGIIVGGSATNEIAGIAKVGAGTLTLVGGTTLVSSGFETVTNFTTLLEYSGPTTISNGTLAVVVPDALTNSSSVTLAASAAILDASQMGYVDPVSGNPVTNSVFEVISGQTLAGLGTIYGFLQTDPGSIFNVGLSGATGIMTVTNAVSLNGTIRLKINSGSTPNSDELISQSSITNGGALVVTNIGGIIPGGTTFTLFHSTIGSYIGTFSSVTLPTLSGSQTWNTSNLYNNGTISVVGSAAPPKFSSVTASGNSIVLSATGGTPGNAVSVLTSTNLLIPVPTWSILTTGSFDGSGNFSYTNSGAFGNPQQFYILQTP